MVARVGGSRHGSWLLGEVDLGMVARGGGSRHGC